MKKKLVVVCLVGLVLVFTSGCSWLVPGAVRRETSLSRTCVETAIKEIEPLSGDAAKEKALTALRLLQPHVVNLDNYAHGQPAEKPPVTPTVTSNVIAVPAK
jgi:hypothetical protein